jgi:hypothetical protein
LKSIGLNLNRDKTKITNINSGQALFLGTTIFRSKHRKYVSNLDPRSGYYIKRRLGNQLRLEAPLKRILKKWHGLFLEKNKSKPRFL